MMAAESLVQSGGIGDIFAGGAEFRQLVMHETVTTAIIEQLRAGRRGGPVGVGALYKYGLVLEQVVRLVKSEIERQRGIYVADPYDFIKGARAAAQLREASSRKRKYAASDVLTAPGRHSADLLSNDERLRVQRVCLQRLGSYVRAGTASTHDGDYRDHLVVGLMLSNSLRAQDLYLMQQQHVLKPHTAANPTADWLIRLPAELVKNRSPKLIRIHPTLRAAWELYIDRVLPGVTKAEADRDHLWFARSGARIVDFGDLVARVLMPVIGRTVKPHKMRATLASSLNTMAGTTEKDMADFARLSGHRRETQEQWYVQSGVDELARLQDRLHEGLDAPVGRLDDVGPLGADGVDGDDWLDL